MTSTTQLLFPCCASQPTPTQEQKGLRRLGLQIITAVALGVILGAGLGAALYFGGQIALMYSTLAGAASALLIGFAIYSALRCQFSRAKTPPPATISAHDIPLSQTSIPQCQFSRAKTPPLATIPAHDIPLSQAGIPQLLRTMDARFPNGRTFTDPSNEMEIPLLRLYQTMLLHPQCAALGKKDLVTQLFAAECERHTPTSLRIYLNYFDSEIIAAIARHVTSEAHQRLFQDYQTCSSPAFQRVRRGRAEIERQLGTLEGRFYFGTALDDGGCFFHSMAQMLTAAPGVKITEKMLRMQCDAYMQQLEDLPEDVGRRTWVRDAINAPGRDNDYMATRMHGRTSSAEWHALSEDEQTQNPLLWGESAIHGVIIAELYGINLVLIEADGEPVELDGQMTYLEGEPTTYRPYRGENHITLRDIGNDVDRNATLYLAITNGHFFPVWKH